MNSSTKCRLLVLLGLVGTTVGGLQLYNGLPTRIVRWHQIPKENLAQGAAIARSSPQYPTYLWEPRGLGELPPGLSKQDSRISLLVGSKEAGHMPVYLINDTDSHLLIPSRDGDINLKLEAKQVDGCWRRAQGHWQDYMCGSGQKFLELPARQYVILKGYLPTAGKRTTVRYSIFNEVDDRLTTDEFGGLCSEDDFALSEFDPMALAEAELPALRSFLLREKSPSLMPLWQNIEDWRRSAWYALMSGRHDMASALRVAKEVVAFDPTLDGDSLPLEKQLLSGATLERQKRSLKKIHGFHMSDKLAQAYAK